MNAYSVNSVDDDERDTASKYLRTKALRNCETPISCPLPSISMIHLILLLIKTYSISRATHRELSTGIA